MAQRVNVVLVDDLDGSDAIETVVFGVDGVSYEIDLSEKNAKKLRDALAPYVADARRTGGRRSTGRGGGRSSSSSAAGDTSEIRAWARANNYEVSDRGRISAAVQEAYKKASK